LRIAVFNSNTELLPNPVVPLGACIAASTAREAGWEVFFCDLAFEKNPAEKVRDFLGRLGPDAAGVSIRNVDNTDFLSPRFYLTDIREKIVAPAVEALPGRVVLGGAGFSTMPEEILEYMGAPVGVVGDAETTFPRILERWAEGKGLEGLSGIVREGPDGPVMEEQAPLPEVLDGLPQARSWGWVQLNRYASYGGWPNLQSKRGCPLRCAYCVYNRVEGKAYRLRSPDSTFNIPLDHAKAVSNRIALGKPGLRLHTSGMNPLQADAELFRLMADAGFASIGISAESASDRALEGLQKGYDASAVARILALAKEAGFDTFWYFLFGGPGENDETVEETLRFLDRKIPPNHLVYLGAGIRIQKGAPVEAVARKQGLLSPGESLLEPKFYFSPELQPEWLLRRLDQEVLAHPNYIQVADYQHSRGPLITARILRWLRYKRPTWTVVPFLNRLFAKLGRRRR
jgi:radical SAM superfamily enzyme YgiQ (UPF0313 family)